MLNHIPKSRVLIASALVALALVAPVQAKFNWRAAWGVLSTVGGVGLGLSGNVGIGVALIGLQGSLLTTEAATEGVVATANNVPDMFDVPGPVTTEPAREALIREYPLLELTGDSEIDYFLQATNEVFESTNVLVRSRLEGAPAEQLKADLREYGQALERAAEEYDRLGLSHTISQGDVDAFQHGVSAEGLPAAEAEFLIALGFNEEEQAAFAELVSTAPVHLTQSVTPGEVLRAAAAHIADME